MSSSPNTPESRKDPNVASEVGKRRESDLASAGESTVIFPTTDWTTSDVGHDTSKDVAMDDTAGGERSKVTEGSFGAAARLEFLKGAAMEDTAGPTEGVVISNVIAFDDDDPVTDRPLDPDTGVRFTRVRSPREMAAATSVMRCLTASGTLFDGSNQQAVVS